MLSVALAPSFAVAQSTPVLSDAEDRCRPGAVPDYDNVRSLEEIFDVVERGVGGEIIKAELQQRSFVDVCVWVYDVKVLTDKGDVKRVAYDASDLRLIGFSVPSSTNQRPLLGTDADSGISAAPSTSSKTLNNPDADGVADSSGGGESSAAAGTESSDTDTAAAADASSAADNSAADAAQRDGKADGTAAADSGPDAAADDGGQSAGGGAASSASGSADGSGTTEGTSAN